MAPRKRLCLEELKYPYCDKVSKFDKLAKIGQGTFGEVFKAKEKSTGKIIALKKILMENEKEGFPITALREIRILKKLSHENIVQLKEVTSELIPPSNLSTFYLVFEFCEHDLAGLLSNPLVKFNLGEIKKVIQQLFNGLYYIHSNKILHRDLKASNVLLTKKGTLKLADFGLARAYSTNLRKENKYTNRVVTLWYRPPELLLGEKVYGSSVDMWGAGCIMAEMWTRTPILQGQTEQHQLELITRLCGSITTDVWPEVNKLELFNKLKLPRNFQNQLCERLEPYVKDDAALKLLEKLLVLDPSKRLTCESVLDNDFFWTDPMPVDLDKALSVHKQSMFEFLAPTRRPVGVQRNPQLQRVPQSSTETTYQQRVY